MDPLVTLTETRLAVTPGARARTRATVRNPGPDADHFRLQVLGQAAGWVELVPSELTLAPGAEATVELRFHPPADGSVPAGETPFGLRCVSRGDPGRATVAEGDLTVESAPAPGRRPGRDAGAPGPRAWPVAGTLAVIGAGAVAVVVALLLALGDGDPGPSAARRRATSAATSAGSTAAPPAGEVQGNYVVFGAYPVEDVAGQEVARRRAAELQAAGIRVKLLDSRRSKVLADGLGGLWVVYWDGFASHDQAVAFCNQHRALAPTCHAPGS